MCGAGSTLMAVRAPPGRGLVVGRGKVAGRLKICRAALSKPLSPSSMPGLAMLQARKANFNQGWCALVVEDRDWVAGGFLSAASRAW